MDSAGFCHNSDTSPTAFHQVSAGVLISWCHVHTSVQLAPCVRGGNVCVRLMGRSLIERTSSALSRDHVSALANSSPLGMGEAHNVHTEYTTYMVSTRKPRRLFLVFVCVHQKTRFENTPQLSCVVWVWLLRRARCFTSTQTCDPELSAVACLSDVFVMRPANRPGRRSLLGRRRGAFVSARVRRWSLSSQQWRQVGWGEMFSRTSGRILCGAVLV